MSTETPPSDLPRYESPVAVALNDPSQSGWPAQLVYDEAMGVFSDEQLCRRARIQLGALHKLREHEPFVIEVDETRLRWATANQAPVSKQAELLTAALLPNLYTLATDGDTPPEHRIRATSLMKSIAGLDKQSSTVNNVNVGVFKVSSKFKALKG